jgi:SPW repeat
MLTKRTTGIRWQDWLSGAIGAWLVASPWELEYTLNGAATSNACGLGGVLIVFNLISAARFMEQGQEIFNILLGLWLVASPYALSFESERAPALNAMIAGASVVVLSGWRLYEEARTPKEKE